MPSLVIQKLPPFFELELTEIRAVPEPLYLVPLTMETSSHQGPSVTLVKDAAKAGAAKPSVAPPTDLKLPPSSWFSQTSSVLSFPFLPHLQTCQPFAKNNDKSLLSPAVHCDGWCRNQRAQIAAKLKHVLTRSDIAPCRLREPIALKGGRPYPNG